MVSTNKVAYEFRLILDGYFLEWIKQQPDYRRRTVYLMYIKQSSSYCPGYHNVILETELDRVAEAVSLDKKKAGKFVKVIGDEDHSLDKVDNIITKNIMFAINLSEDLPRSCVILTSPEKQEEYNKSPHMNGIKRVVVWSEKRAIDIIDNFFKKYAENKEFNR